MYSDERDKVPHTQKCPKHSKLHKNKSPSQQTKALPFQKGTHELVVVLLGGLAMCPTSRILNAMGISMSP